MAINPILETMDYSLFVPLRDNRNVVPRRVQKIINSILAHGDRGKDFPILVEPRMLKGRKVLGIRSGQHRFAARKEMKRPIYYKEVEEDYTSAQLGGIERATSSWSPTDCFQAFKKNHEKEYVKLAGMLEHYELPLLDDRAMVFSAIQVFLYLVTGEERFAYKVSSTRTGASSSFMDSIRLGTYKHPEQHDEELAALLVQTYNCIRASTAPTKALGSLENTGAARIMKAIFAYCEEVKRQGWNLKQMLRRFIKRAEKTDARVCTTVDTVIRFIEENHNRNERNDAMRIRVFAK